jgi:NADH-quinone oxidoreductase subunit G
VESTCTACAWGAAWRSRARPTGSCATSGIDVDPVNWGWLCDKGRFSFEATNAEERLGTPLVREGDALVEATWSEALTRVADGLSGAVDGDPTSVAVLGGARLPNEDAYAWSKLARSVLGTDNVDAQMGDGLPAEAVLGLPRASIDAACAAGTVVLLAPDIKEELPVLYLRLRDAVVSKGLRIIEIAPADTGMTRLAAASLRYRPGGAAQLVEALVGGGRRGGGDQAALDAAAELLGDGPVVCVLGRPSVAETGDSIAAAAGALLAARPGHHVPLRPAAGGTSTAPSTWASPPACCRVASASTTDAGRFTTAWGDLPASKGPRRGGPRCRRRPRGASPPWCSWAPTRWATCPTATSPAGAWPAPASSSPSTPSSPASSSAADVVLPAVMAGEQAGTTTNIEGRISRLNQKVTTPGTSRPDWMIAVELASRMGADLGVESLDDLWDEIERGRPEPPRHDPRRAALAAGLDGVLAGEVDDVATTERRPP